jgi:hypothetical protein
MEMLMAAMCVGFSKMMASRRARSGEGADADRDRRLVGQASGVFQMISDWRFVLTFLSALGCGLAAVLSLFPPSS